MGPAEFLINKRVPASQGSEAHLDFATDPSNQEYGGNVFPHTRLPIVLHFIEGEIWQLPDSVLV